jgi:hypothetical protein
MLAIFPSPAGMSLTKLSDIQAGDGKFANFFYSVYKIYVRSWIIRSCLGIWNPSTHSNNGSLHILSLFSLSPVTAERYWVGSSQRVAGEVAFIKFRSLTVSLRSLCRPRRFPRPLRLTFRMLLSKLSGQIFEIVLVLKKW